MITFLLWLVKRGKLSDKDRLKVINSLIDTCGLPPMRPIIREENGKTFIRDKEVSPEERISLSDSADIALNNPVRKMVSDQLRYEAMEAGLHKSTDMYHVVFGKVAIWLIEKEEEKLRELRGTYIT